MDWGFEGKDAQYGFNAAGRRQFSRQRTPPLAHWGPATPQVFKAVVAIRHFSELTHLGYSHCPGNHGLISSHFLESPHLG